MKQPYPNIRSTTPVGAFGADRCVYAKRVRGIKRITKGDRSRIEGRIDRRAIVRFRKVLCTFAGPNSENRCNRHRLEPVARYLGLRSSLLEPGIRHSHRHASLLRNGCLFRQFPARRDDGAAGPVFVVVSTKCAAVLDPFCPFTRHSNGPARRDTNARYFIKARR